MKNGIFNKKNILIFVAIILVVAATIALFVLNTNKSSKNNNEKEEENKKIENINDLVDKLNEVGGKWYQDHYYVIFDNKEDLGRFKETGINVDLDSVSKVYEIDEETKNALDKYKCNYENTKLHIYPKEPYKADNYTIKVDLSCENK